MSAKLDTSKLFKQGERVEVHVCRRAKDRTVGLGRNEIDYPYIWVAGFFRGYADASENTHEYKYKVQITETGQISYFKADSIRKVPRGASSVELANGGDEIL